MNGIMRWWCRNSIRSVRVIFHLNDWHLFPILTYSFGFTGRSNIESAFKNTGLELDITLAAADTDVIKTYVRLGDGCGPYRSNGL
jgi:DNA-binding transcriptional LysR family regulator